MTHAHIWIRTPEDDSNEALRFKCECGARGWATRGSWVRLGAKKARVTEYKRSIPKEKAAPSVTARRTSDGRVGPSAGWHGKAK